MKTLNRAAPFDDVGVGRNWRYVQGGHLFSVNGIEVDAKGNMIGDGPEPAPVIEPPAPATMTVGKVDEDKPMTNTDFTLDTDTMEVTEIKKPDINLMSYMELKGELKAAGVAFKGNSSTDTLRDLVTENRNVEA